MINLQQNILQNLQFCYSGIWLEQRDYCLTASSFGRILKRGKSVENILLRNLSAF